MANFTEMGSGMPNIFNFIPEAGKSGSGINDLAGLLALSKDGNNNDGWGGQWAVWLIFILAFCNGGFGGFGRNGFGAATTTTLNDAETFTNTCGGCPDGAFNKFSRNVALEFAVAATPGA